MADRQDEVVQVIAVLPDLVVGEHILAEVVVSGKASICSESVLNDSNFRFKGDLLEVQFFFIRLDDVRGRLGGAGTSDVGLSSSSWDLWANFMVLGERKLFVLVVGHDHKDSRGTEGLKLTDGESLKAVQVVDNLVGVVVDVVIPTLTLMAA